MGFIIRVLVNAVALMALAYVNFMGIHADNITASLIGGLVLGIANAIVRPILIVVSCPLEVISLGLFTLVINAVIFYFGLKYVPGYHVPGFGAAFWGAIVMSIISWIISLVFHDAHGARGRARR
ncbi:MAG: hypothetical protein DLM53_09745 [Candidatus Eremiobacter antarcticus]|nr:phage holin family protein [Candidatus Eremiobacteraeota bacterium]MBC5808607.1 phage holin family protein [Candidatus Eremiobacteraeota bacterium]PZR61128.1 MAG: hypothetical protein DLM53_09745 [Candidatus Eremiobacter sp. RRmetagenome_bin22]